DRQEMVASELADLAREPHGAISQQDLRFADAARVEQDLPRRREARRVFVPEAEIERAKRDPAGFAAPPDMDQPLAIGQEALETGAGLRRRLALEPRRERERPRGDP